MVICSLLYWWIIAGTVTTQVEKVIFNLNAQYLLILYQYNLGCKSSPWCLLTHCTGVHTHTGTFAGAYARTHGKRLTGHMMEGNVFLFGLFEKDGSIFPRHLYSESAVSHTTHNLKQWPSLPVELTGCPGLVSDLG